MIVRNDVLEQLGYKINEEELITTNILHDQDIPIPSGYLSGYPTRSQSPNKTGSMEMVEARATFANGKLQRNLQRVWLQS